jgi:hypothetical protein
MPGIKIGKKFVVIENQEAYQFYLNVLDLVIVDF